MSYKRKGQLSKSPEWCKHLRKSLHRQFWKTERASEKKFINEQLTEDLNDNEYGQPPVGAPYPNIGKEK